MKESLLIIIFVVIIYFLFGYLRKLFAGKYKWQTPIQYVLTILLFTVLFYKRINWPANASDLSLNFLLFVALMGYFIYKIYDEIQILNKQHK